MKRHPRRLLRFVLAPAILAVGLILMVSQSQGQIPAVEKEVPFAIRQLFVELRGGIGGKKFNDPDPKVVEENRMAVGEMAKYMAYRLDTSPYNGIGDDPLYTRKEPMPTDDKPITRLMNEAYNSMLFPSSIKGPSPDQMVFINEYGKALEKECMFVLKQASKPIVRINASRMLAQTAKMPYLGIADSFLAILKDPKELEGVKMYACQGLRDVLQHNDKIEPSRSAIVDPTKLAEIANTLIDYIHQTNPKAATDPEVARVVQYTRREGVRALAAIRVSVIRDPQRKILATPALPLLRIAMCDPRFVPQPSLSEQMEALIGFCSMRIDRDLDVAAAVRGVHIAIMDMTRKQNIDPNHPGRERTLPWKIAGAKLSQAMDKWKTNAEEIPVAQEPKLIYEYSKLIQEAALSKFESEGLSARPDAATLNQLRTNLEPKSKILLKGDPNSSLEPVTTETPPKK